MTEIKGIRGVKVNSILKGVCEYYGVAIDELTTSTKGKHGTIWRWKRFLIPILHDHTDLVLTEIQQVLGYKHYHSVHDAHKALRDELSDSIYGDKKLKRNYEELVKHLGL